MKRLLRSFTQSSAAPKIILLALLAAGSVVLSLCCGAVPLTLREVLAALTGRALSPESAAIVLYSRLPRTLGCLFAGAALSTAGAVIQSVLNNPLAAPNVIAVNSGAGLFVVLCAAFFPTGARFVPLVAFLGALFGMMIVLLIARKTGASKMTLVLSGIATSYVFSALIDAVVTVAPDALVGYSDFRIGGLADVSMERVLPAAGVIVVALALSFLLSGSMEILTLGEQTAQSLGVNTRFVRLALLTLAAALAGAAVSFSGLLGFVGMVVPHLMRRVVGEESRPLLLSCVFGGAAFLLLCDLLSRTLFTPYELPVGIVLSLLGGPFFIALLLYQRGGRTHD